MLWYVDWTVFHLYLYASVTWYTQVFIRLKVCSLLIIVLLNVLLVHLELILGQQVGSLIWDYIGKRSLPSQQSFSSLSNQLWAYKVNILMALLGQILKNWLNVAIDFLSALEKVVVGLAALVVGHLDLLLVSGELRFLLNDELWLRLRLRLIWLAQAKELLLFDLVSLDLLLLNLHNWLLEQNG